MDENAAGVDGVTGDNPSRDIQCGWSQSISRQVGNMSEVMIYTVQPVMSLKMARMEMTPGKCESPTAITTRKVIKGGLK